MKKILSFLIFISLSCTMLAQVKGVIKDELTEENLPFVNVYWLKGGGGTISDSTGSFSINRKEGQNRLVFSFVGYKKDTIDVKNTSEPVIVFLKRMMTDIDRVVVTSRIKSSAISSTSDQQKEIITADALKFLACCNLGESFENSATVDVGYSDAVSGAKQIQMLGLSGVYSQMLLENIPYMRGMAAPMGLSYVPGQWLESISVSKGVATVKNGYEVITGTIDLDFEKPFKGDLLSVNLYGNSDKRGEATIKSNYMFNDKLSTGLLLYGTYNNSPMNMVGNDDFMDYPNNKQYSLVNRWHYDNKKGFVSQTLVNYTHDERDGGQMPEIANRYITNSVVDRAFISTKNGKSLTNTSSIGTQVAFSYYNQDASYGPVTYSATSKEIYANVLYNAEVRGGHILDIGASIRYNDDTTHSFSSQFTGNTFKNHATELVPGVFSQYTFRYDKKFIATLGLRYDYNTYYEKHLLTPRLHLKWKIIEDLIFRASIGKGYRSAYPLADNLSLFSTKRNIVIADNIDMEEAWNMGANIMKTIPLAGNRELSISLDYYHTNFLNQLVVDWDANPAQVTISNLKDINNGKSFSNVVQLDFNYEIFKGMNITLAGKYNDVQCTYGNKLMRKPYTSLWKGLAVLSYRTPFDKWIFDLTTQFNGPQRIPNTLFDTPKESDPYVYMMAQITHKMKDFEVYVGVENITNYTQENVVLGDPMDATLFDASVIYSPIMGRIFYAGLRYTIK